MISSAPKHARSPLTAAARGALGRRSARRIPREKPGVSLLELLVVLIILGVVTGIVTPAFMGATSRAPRAALDARVASLLSAARRQAIESGRRLTLTIDPSTRRTWLTVDDPSSTDEAHVDSLTAEPGASIEDSTVRLMVVFTSDGRSFGDSVIVRAGGRTTVLTADRWSGAPRAATR